MIDTIKEHLADERPANVTIVDMFEESRIEPQVKLTEDGDEVDILVAARHGLEAEDSFNTLVNCAKDVVIIHAVERLERSRFGKLFIVSQKFALLGTV